MDLANALFVVLVILSSLVVSDVLLAVILAMIDVLDPAKLRTRISEILSRVRTS